LSKPATKVPFADLSSQYRFLKAEIDAAIEAVIDQNAFIHGPFVEKFESEFAAAVGVSHCVSCANGTDALYIAMKALGVGPGDEVIVPAMSWISTSETVTQAGAKVVFCDVEADTYTIDPNDVRQRVTDRTVGIIPVHLYGQPAGIDAIKEIAERHGLWVIEDCAQAHLAMFDGKMVGTFGDAATFSFFPGKNLGAMGDAGAIVTNDVQLAERMTMFARHGGLVKGEHKIEGINSRLDGLQAAILSVKLPHLRDWTEKRHARAREYTSQLAGIDDITIPMIGTSRKHVWHLYVIEHPDRDALRANLTAQGIMTGIHYPTALPFLPCYKYLGHRPEDFPVAYAMQERILSLPIFAEMTVDMVGVVTQAIRRFCEGS